jgi:hypothetical protein
MAGFDAGVQLTLADRWIERGQDGAGFVVDW